jgi:hypothetical protein
MTSPFPGGVADPTRGIAFTRLAGDEIVAVDLSTGAVRWRRVGLGRPIGAVADGLLTIVRNDGTIDVAIVEAETGTTRGLVRNVPVPAWVADELQQADGFAAIAVQRNDAIEIVWKARQLYREGSPPRQREPGGRTEVQGRFLIPAGSAVAVDQTASASNIMTPTSEPHFETPMDTTLGDYSYVLESVTRIPGEVSVVLKSRNQSSGSIVWESEIKRLSQSRPPPRRM